VFYPGRPEYTGLFNEQEHYFQQNSVLLLFVLFRISFTAPSPVVVEKDFHNPPS
jgi:hypothetical protein